MDNKQINPLSSQGATSPVMNLSESDITNIGTETIQYSIHTMAQDLERAKKEGVSSTTVSIKTPTIPPPPPPKMPPPKPIAPTAPIAPKPTVVAPPTIKPIAETPLKIPTPEISPLKREPVSVPIPMPTIPVPTIKREIPPPVELPIMPSIKGEAVSVPIPPPTIKRETPTTGLPITPRPSITSAIPSSAIPTPTPTIKPTAVPTTKKPFILSLPQLNSLIGIVAVAIILLGSVGLSYWWFFIKQVPIQQPPIEDIPPVITEPILPEKISQTDIDITIETSTKIPSLEIASSLQNKISSSTQRLDDKQLGRILIKYSTDTEKSYLSFAESLALLQIAIPDDINSNIKDGEILAYNQGGQIRYGFATTISNTLSILNAMKIWEKTILSDVDSLYFGSSPIKPQDPVFQDDYKDNFIIRYLNLPTSTLSIAWAESDEKQVFIVATSKNMTYRIIGIKEVLKPTTKTYPSGTLVKEKVNNKIYRIIDDKKLWIPTIKAFLDSGYKPYSETEITKEELDNFEDVKYIKISTDKKIYELRNDKRHLISDTSTLPQQEIKIVTQAELNAYPLEK